MQTQRKVSAVLTEGQLPLIMKWRKDALFYLVWNTLIFVLLVNVMAQLSQLKNVYIYTYYTRLNIIKFSQHLILIIRSKNYVHFQLNSHPRHMSIGSFFDKGEAMNFEILFLFQETDTQTLFITLKK